MQTVSSATMIEEKWRPISKQGKDFVVKLLNRNPNANITPFSIVSAPVSIVSAPFSIVSALFSIVWAPCSIENDAETIENGAETKQLNSSRTALPKGLAVRVEFKC